MNDPFRYRPSERMTEIMEETVKAIAGDSLLHGVFREGKMLGILRYEPDGYLLAYSGKRIPGVSGVGEHSFVPPIFDVTEGYFKEKEAEISNLNASIASSVDEDEIQQLKIRRAMESVKLQRWTFGQYKVLNALGEERSILDIFADKCLTPPAAAGDCAAPKLLQYAYSHGLTPLEIGEFWYGDSPAGPVRAEGRFYPACSWKCGPVLGYMLKGLSLANPVRKFGEPSIVLEDDSIIVVDKPSGMPAVPGLDGLESLEDWLRAKVSGELYQIHRLDQDTSGLLVFGKTRKAQGFLQRQFENHSVAKTYIAIVDGVIEGSGTISLPLAPDYEDKPRQKVDRVQGKEAVTDYSVLSGDRRSAAFALFGLPCVHDLTAVEFRPRTGRSHQLRVHAAHRDGLGCPIVGDTLYGSAGLVCGMPSVRLCLHAASLRFIHPDSGVEISCSEE